MKNLFYILSCIALAFLISSCGDDSSTNASGNDKNSGFFPSKTGNYWVYEHRTIDTNGVLAKNVSSFDSVLVAKDTVILAKNCKLLHDFVFDSLMKKPQLTNKYNYYDNSKLYVHSSQFLDNAQNLLFSGTIPEDWIKLIDFESDLWRVYKINFDTLSILKDTNNPFSNFIKIKSGSVDIQGEKGKSQIINIAGQSVTANEFIVTQTFDADIVAANLPLHIKFPVKTHYFYANGIGLVKEVQDPYTMSLAIIEFKNAGYQKLLIRHSIK